MTRGVGPSVSSCLISLGPCIVMTIWMWCPCNDLLVKGRPSWKQICPSLYEPHLFSMHWSGFPIVFVKFKMGTSSFLSVSWDEVHSDGFEKLLIFLTVDQLSSSKKGIHINFVFIISTCLSPYFSQLLYYCSLWRKLSVCLDWLINILLHTVSPACKRSSNFPVIILVIKQSLDGTMLTQIGNYLKDVKAAFHHMNTENEKKSMGLLLVIVCLGFCRAILQIWLPLMWRDEELD